MRIITAYQTKNDCFKEARKMTPSGIVIHSTGANNKNLKRYVDAPDEVGKNLYGNHWNRKNVAKMVHAFIGLDKNGEVAIVNTLPYNYCAWGVGKGKKGSYNYSPAYIQFEICEDSLKDKGYFEEVFKNAIEYCAYLCKELSINADSVISHAEAHKQGYASNHSDCDHWLSKFEKSMDDVRAEIGKLLNGEEEQEEPFEPYLVKASGVRPRIRTGAGTDYRSKGVIPKGVYTIVKESEGKGATMWGKLKSGAGWISLDYVTKL